MDRRSFLKVASLALPTIAGCSTRSVPQFSERPFDHASYGIHAVAYSPDGSKIATAHSALRQRDAGCVLYAGIPQGYVRLWMAEDHYEHGFVAAEKLGRMPFPFFDDQGNVAVLAENEVLLCDGAGSILRRLSIERALLADAPRKRLFLAVDEDPTCMIVADFEGQPLSEKLRDPSGESLQAVAWRGVSPDGKLLATTPCTGGEFEIVIWNWEAAEAVARIPCRERVYFWQAAFSPDSKSIAILPSEHVVRLLDIASTKLISSFEYRDGWISDLSFSPNGQRVAACGEGIAKKSGQQFGFIRIWDVSSGRIIADIKRPDVWGVTAIAFAPDGRTLSAGLSDGRLVAYSRAIDS